jgi:hypothetical protein
MSVEIFPDDLVQTLSFLGRPQLLKFMFINRLFFVLIEEYFSTRPFLNAILRIWSEPQDDQEADGDEVKHHIYLGIGLLENKNAFLLEGEKKKHRLLERKITRKWQWWLNADYQVGKQKNQFLNIKRYRDMTYPGCFFDTTISI